MEERNTSRRPRREKAEEQPRNESLVYGKNPVTELLKSGSGVDTVLLAEAAGRIAFFHEVLLPFLSQDAVALPARRRCVSFSKSFHAAVQQAMMTHLEV